MKRTGKDSTATIRYQPESDEFSPLRFRGHPNCTLNVNPGETTDLPSIMGKGIRNHPSASAPFCHIRKSQESKSAMTDSCARRFGMDIAGSWRLSDFISMTMLKQLICAFSIVSICGVKANAQTEQDDLAHVDWGESGGWMIKVDPSVGNGCYMEKALEDGTLVQVGFVPDRDGGFFAAYNATWTGIENEAEGTVYFDFGKSLFGGDYVGTVKNALPGGYAFFNNPEFVKEFGKQNDVSITGDKGNALKFKLTGTLKAINAVRNCDAEQKE